MTDTPAGAQPTLLQTKIKTSAQVDGRLVEFDRITIVPTDLDQCIAFWKPGQQTAAADLGFRITNESALSLYHLLGQALKATPRVLVIVEDGCAEVSTIGEAEVRVVDLDGANVGDREDDTMPADEFLAGFPALVVNRIQNALATCTDCNGTDDVQSTYCGSFGRGCGCLAKHCETCEVCAKDFA